MPEREDEKDGQFQEAYDLADDEVAAVGSIKRDDEPEPEPAPKAEEPPTS